MKEITKNYAQDIEPSSLILTEPYVVVDIFQLCLPNRNLVSGNGRIAINFIGESCNRGRRSGEFERPTWRTWEVHEAVIQN